MKQEYSRVCPVCWLGGGGCCMCPAIGCALVCSAIGRLGGIDEHTPVAYGRPAHAQHVYLPYYQGQMTYTRKSPLPLKSLLFSLFTMHAHWIWWIVIRILYCWVAMVEW